MAVLIRFTTCWRILPARQLVFLPRALHRSAASEALEIPATGEEAMSGRLIAPVAEAAAEEEEEELVRAKPRSTSQETRIKSLKEMPGPGTLSNLIEFFFRDGFSRVHEIQVRIKKTGFKLTTGSLSPQRDPESVRRIGYCAELLRKKRIRSEFFIFTPNSLNFYKDLL